MTRTPTQDLILASIRKSGPKTPREVAESVGRGTSLVGDRMYWMALSGKLVKISRGLYATPTQAEIYSRLRALVKFCGNSLPGCL